MLTSTQKSHLVDVAVNTFDFCGNMSAAVRQACRDDGWAITDNELAEVLIEAHQIAVLDL